MSDQIKNTFTKLKSGHVQVIKGRQDFHIHVKDLYINNNTTKSVYCDVYIVDSNEVKTYLFKNIIIPSKKRLDVPNKKNIELEFRDFIFVEISDPDLETDLDIFCNYIQTEIVFKKVNIQFQNQNKRIVRPSDLSYSIIDNSVTGKTIKFTESSSYTPIPEIKYSIIGNKLTIFKIPNLLPPEYDFIELEDRYILDITSSKKKIIIPETVAFLNISFNILTSLTRDSKWRYSTDGQYLEEDIWYDPNTQLLMEEGSYYFTFSNIEGYIRPNDDYFKINNNTLVECKYEYKSTLGYLKIKTDYVIDNLRWNVLNEEGELSEDYYLNSMIELPEGYHNILINGIVDVFEDTTYNIYINHGQTHFLNHNIQEYSPTIKVNVENIQNIGFWQFGDNNVFDESYNWYFLEDELTIYPGSYYINFKDIDNYTKPELKRVIITNNIRLEVTEKYISNFGDLCIINQGKIDEQLFKSIKWRVINSDDMSTKWLKYSDVHNCLFGEYNIEIQNIIDFIENLSVPVNVYKQQKTTLLLDSVIGV